MPIPCKLARVAFAQGGNGGNLQKKYAKPWPTLTQRGNSLLVWGVVLKLVNPKQHRQAFVWAGGADHVHGARGLLRAGGRGGAWSLRLHLLQDGEGVSKLRTLRISGVLLVSLKNQAHNEVTLKKVATACVFFLAGVD